MEDEKKTRLSISAERVEGRARAAFWQRRLASYQSSADRVLGFYLHPARISWTGTQFTLDDDGLTVLVDQLRCTIPYNLLVMVQEFSSPKAICQKINSLISKRDQTKAEFDLTNSLRRMEYRQRVGTPEDRAPFFEGRMLD